MTREKETLHCLGLEQKLTGQLPLGVPYPATKPPYRNFYLQGFLSRPITSSTAHPGDTSLGLNRDREF